MPDDLEQTNSTRLRHLLRKLAYPFQRALMLAVLGFVTGTAQTQAAFDIGMTVDGSNVVDVGQFRSINVSYSWSSLTQNLANGQIVIDLPATLATSASDVQVFGSAHTTSATYNSGTKKITYVFVNPLPAGSSGTVQFAVRFPTNASNGTQAAINATSTGTGQPNGTSSATLTANVPPPVTNVQFNKWANINPMLGQDVIYSMDVQNSGGTDLLAHTVVDQLPSGSVFVSADNGGSYNAGNGQMTWNGSPLVSGASRSYKVTVRYDSPTFSSGQAVPNTASLAGTDSLSAPVSKTANATVTIAPPPSTNLVMSKTANRNPMLGENVIYTITVTNNGGTTYLNPVFVDQLPAGAVYVSSNNGGNYNSSTNKVTWTLSSPIAPGGSVSVQVTVRYDAPTYSVGQSVINGVTGTGTDSLGAPVNLSANKTVVIQPPPATILAMSKTADRNPALGEPVNYTISVSNTGGNNYLNAVWVDQMPAGTVFVSANRSGVYDSGANTVTWNLGTVSVGTTQSVTVTVKYDAPTFSTGQFVTNTATGTGIDALGAPVNLTANCTVQIAAPNPSAYVNKWDSVDPVSVKGALTYYFGVANTGNVPLTSYTFDDSFPPEFIPTMIHPGSDPYSANTSNISVSYKTISNGSWQTLPGSPFTVAPGNDPAVAVSSLGLAPGDAVTGVRYVFAALPLGYNTGSMVRVVGTMGHPTTGLDRNGAAITGLPKTINNTYNVTYVHSSNTYSGSDTETTQLIPVAPKPKFGIADASPLSYAPLQEITWQLDMNNHSSATDVLINPVYATLLPATLEYVPGSAVVIGGPLPTPVVTVTSNHNGTGRQLVKFAFTGSHPVGGATEYLDFKTKVRAGAAVGNYEAEYHLLSSGNGFIDGSQASKIRIDTNDLDSDGNTTETFLTSNGGDYSVSSSTGIDSVLWVKGQLDSTFNRFPDAGSALPGGTVQFKLIVTNPGNVSLTGIRVMDILPHVGDTGVVLYNISRGSDFGLSLTSTVTAPAGITVKYSTATNPVRSDLDATLSSPAGAVSGTFSTTAPSPLSNTKSLLFDFGATVLAPGESKEILWSMNMPGAVSIGQVAWNSFGHRSQSAVTGTPLPPSEPIKVGVANPVSIGSFVWQDTNNNGIQDSGEPGIVGAQLAIFQSNGTPALDPIGGTVPPATSGAGGLYVIGALADGDYFIRVTPPAGYIASAVQVPDPDDDNDTDSNIDTTRTPPLGTYESGVFTFAVNTEPVFEPGAGGTQDDADDDNGNMTIDFGLFLVPDDFGDYSSFANASSTVSAMIKLGTAVTDAETVPVKNAAASGDDITGTDDEDGVTFGALVQGQTGSVTVHRTNTSGADAYLNAWIDFNHNGSLADPGEQIISNVTLPGATSGSLAYAFSIPTNALIGNAGARFRITSTSNPGPTGASGSGEVEDHLADIQPSLTIGNLVWDDINNNGIKDAAEPGFNGVTVQLFSPGADNAIGGAGANADTQIGSNFVTGPTGAYVFSSLAPGKYFVRVTPPAGHITSGTPATTDNNVDNNNDGSQPAGLGTPIFSPIIDLAINGEPITDGDTDPNTNMTVDFGLWSGIQLGDLVWFDANNNGVKDVAETGISGLTVELLNQSGNTVLATTTTNASGIYGFTVYTAGNYKVRVMPSVAYPLASSSYTNADNGVDNDNNGSQTGNKSTPSTSPTITLTAGGEPGSSGSTNTENTIDFGFRGCPTISNAPTTLTGGNVGAPYSSTVTASGGVAPYTYAITSGSLPAGLSLASGTGVISGTTSVSGNHVITITSTDALGCTGVTSITVPISATPTFDYSDYSGFPVASNFASTTLSIGPLIDADASNPSNGTASGDDLSNTDDEDGFVEPINLVPSVTGSTVVKVTNTTGATAYLNAWIDFNRNGTLIDAGEQVAVNAPIATGRINSNETITINTPAGALVGFNVIRIRLTSASSPTSVGAGGMGEVEDHPVNVCPTLGYAYGTQSGDLYQIDVATGVVSQAATLPAAFTRANGAAFAQDLGTDGVVLYTTGTTALKLGAWDRATGATNTVGDFASFGVPTSNPIYSGDYFNGWFYFIQNNTDDLWKAKITGTSGNYTLVSASKVADIWSNNRSHGYGDFVITPGGILYAHANRNGGSAEFFTANLNLATPVATQLGSPPFMHNGITLGLDGKLYGGLGVNSNNANWFEVSLVNGASTFIRIGAVSGMSDMTMGACTPSPYLVINDPFANSDFGDFSFVTGASSIVDNNIKLGALVDAESAIANNATATADDLTGVDDEDGVTFGQLVQGQTGSVTIARKNISGSNAYLNAWIDFDNDGLLNGPGEMIINNLLIPHPTNSTVTYNFSIPAGAYIGDVGSRFRITSTSNPGSTGPSGTGEVEDHLATIQPALTIGNLVWNDLNNNGIKDATETGFNGALVQLFNPGADNAIGGTGANADTQAGSNFTTGATGAYSFALLPPGKYFVKVTPPAGYITGGTPATTDNNVDNNNDGSQPGGIGSPLFSPIIDLAINGESITDGDTDPNSNMTVDFGLFPGMQLGDQVWYDANDNGVKDGAETGISGLLVELLNASTNAVITSTTTNASGQYGFTVYSSGSYKVRVTPSPAYPLASTSFVIADNGVDHDNNGQQPGMKGTPSTSGAFTLTPMGEPGPAGTSNTENTIDFGFRTCPTVTVNTTPTPLDIAVMKRPYSQAANATGGWAPYAFTISSGALPPGITISAGGVFSGTPTADGIFNATILATDAKGCTGQTNVSIEVLPPLSIGNLVFLDNNGSGHYDAGEGVDGVTMELYSSAQTPGVSTPLATTVTAGGGLYLFEGLLPGFYRVHVPAAMFGSGAPLDSTISVAEGLSGDDDVGENGINSLIPAITGISSGLVTMQPGQAPTDLNGETGVNHASDNAYDAAIDLTIDFGFANPLGVGNLVFIDVNTNGHYDPGEGAPGVTVELYRSVDTPGTATPVASQLTDANGHFLFDYLLAGSYFIYVPANVFSTGGALEGKVSISGAGTGPIDDSVDENGVDDIAPQIYGIRSTIFTLANNSAPTDATGENGFQFNEDSRDDNNYDLTIDLGFRAPDPNAVGVGNTVFLDANGNQLFDPGEGVNGVTVRLYAAAANPANTPPLSTTVTANGGVYLFPGLSAGEYFIQIPASMFANGAPLGNSFSLPGQGDDNGIDDVQDENGDDPASPAATGVRSTTIELYPNTEPTNTGGEYGNNAFMDDADDNNTDLTIDFGFYRPVGVGNLVFIDSNRNGLYNAGEGINGVTVELYYDTQSPGFEPPLATTVTAGGGFYLFSSLVPGYYIVHIPTTNFAPGGVLAAFSPLTGQGGDDGSDDDLDENGSDPALAWAEGVSSMTINLSTGTEPTDQTTERGAGAASDNATDSDVDLTVDFGFYAADPASFAQWQAQNQLGGLNGPTDDPDGDGMSNAAEYALGLSPDTGVLPWCPFELKVNATSNKVDAMVKKVSGIADVTVTLQGINDLAASPGGWFDITSLAPEVVGTASGIETSAWRDLEQLAPFAGGRGFVRLHVELDTDDDGTPEAAYNTEVWGWSRHALQAQFITYSNPFSKCAVFTGAVTSVTGNSLDVAAAVGNDAIAGAMTGAIPWYIEIISGDNEGHRFEVDELNSTATAIVLETSNALNTLTTIPASLAGDRVVLRPHWTLAEWLPPAKFRGTNSSSTADRLMFYTGSSFSSYWLFANFGNPKWVNDATLVDRGTRVMDPAEALLIQPRSVSTPAFVNLGVVRANKFACPIKQGTRLIGGGWPMDQSATSRNMLYTNGFTGASSATRSDRIQIWNGDATPGVTSYTSHYLLKVSTLEQWVKVGDAALTNENNLPLFKSMHGVYFNSYIGKPDYVAPRPWTP